METDAKFELVMMKDNSFKIRVLLIYFAMIILFSFAFKYGLIYASISFLSFFYATKTFLNKDYKQGILLLQKGEIEAAQQAFESNYNKLKNSPLFSKYLLLDIFYSNRKICQELSLAYVAYCYYLHQNQEKVTAIYQQMSTEFPKGKIQQAMKKSNALSGSLKKV